MNTATNQATLTGINTTTETGPVSAGMRLAQYSMLNELPGVVFGLITVAYIFGSLLSLAR